MMTEEEKTLLKNTAREIMGLANNGHSVYRSKLIQQIAQGILDYDHELYLAQIEIKALTTIIERDTKAREAFLEKSYKGEDKRAIREE